MVDCFGSRSKYCLAGVSEDCEEVSLVPVDIHGRKDDLYYAQDKALQRVREAVG